METKTKISDFIPKIRDILKDPQKVHYSDATIASGVVDAIRRLRSRRPSVRYSAQHIVDVEFPADDSLVDFEVSIDDKFILGIVYFATARCYEGDIKDLVHQQLAAQFKQLADAEFLM